MRLSRRGLSLLTLAPGLILAAGGAWFWYSRSIARQTPGYVGSLGCRECHERFYTLWSTSHHGLAMQPFSPALARSLREAPASEITVGDHRYVAEIGPDSGLIRAAGPGGQTTYPMAHALGGKNVYYILTPMERGRLQVLPLAFDVGKKEWFDAAGSMIRHFAELEDRSLDWRDPALTFNTSCHGCHVSQLATNYDPASDSYRTTWAEPGINCETCHGAAGEHVRLFRKAKPGETPRELGLVSYKKLTGLQQNETCAPCHAKLMVLTQTFTPGGRFFDHFDLASFENPDFYPDGRDLGENYTYNSWLLSPCVKAGKLDCIFCHTSSGRFRWKDNPNGACQQCHEDKTDQLTKHTRHATDSPGSRCISCHMPMTEFARMRRSDHSMLPPTPAATVAFQSPNACNLCHADRDAKWADLHVRKWRARDYQKPVLHRAGLVAAARRRDWSRLQEMLQYIASPERDELFATSLIRLLENCPDEGKWPTLSGALTDPSPLVRGAAATHLAANLTIENRDALLRATNDGYRLVRIRAARSLAQLPRDALGTEDRSRLERASQELVASMQSRLDDWGGHFNLGSYLLDRGEPQRAIASFETASKLRPDVAMPYVNAAIAHARLGQNYQAGQALRKALEIEPKNAAAHFNLGLLKAEENDVAQAESHLRAALAADPEMAEAAYNLGVLLARDRPDEALTWCRKAVSLRPASSKYLYTLAFFLDQRGRADEAAPLLRRTVAQDPAYADAYALLGAILERQGRMREAEALYRQAISGGAISDQDRSAFEARLKAR